MAYSNKRKAPADPRAIAAAAALRRGADLQEERRTRRTPGDWGVSPDLLALESSRNIDVSLGNRARLVAARRSDAFRTLSDSGSLRPEQNTAALRYCKNVLVAAGVRDGDTWRPGPAPDEGPGAGISWAMVDAARDNAEAEKRLGILDVRLLRALAEPAEIRPWRELVAELTGRTERHAQVACVWQAVENLRLAFEVVDRDHDRRRRPANDNEPA